MNNNRIIKNKSFYTFKLHLIYLILAASMTQLQKKRRYERNDKAINYQFCNLLSNLYYKEYA